MASMYCVGDEYILGEGYVMGYGCILCVMGIYYDKYVWCGMFIGKCECLLYMEYILGDGYSL